MSDKVRRSKRLKKMNADHQSNGEMASATSKHSHHTASKNSHSSKASASIRRQKLEAELECERQKQDIEMELKKQDVKRQQKLLDLELALKLAHIDEENGEEDGKSVLSKSSDVQKWINEQNLYDRPSALEQEAGQATNKQDRQETRQADRQSHILTPATSLELKQLLARQCIDKELPTFSGDLQEWPNFYTQFLTSTKISGFNDEENLCRLRTCLKGDAKRAVQGMLFTGSSLGHILEVLKSRFGRPDLIVRSLINDARNLPIVKTHDFKGLINFADTVSNLVATLEAMKMNNYLDSPQLLDELLQKLPYALQQTWGEITAKRFGRVSLKDFKQWIWTKSEGANYAMALPSRVSSFGNKEDLKDRFNMHKFKPKHAALVTVEKSRNGKMCICCQSDKHALDKCEKFIKSDVDGKWKIVTENNVCFCCLRIGHRLSTCYKKRKCNINECFKFHHPLLHKENVTEENKVGRTAENRVKTMKTESLLPSSSSNANNHENLLSLKDNGHQEVLLRMIKVKIYGNNDTFIETTALCDEGSTVTLLDETIAQKLELQGKRNPLCIQWTNGITSCHENSVSVSLSISGAYPAAKIFPMNNVRTVENLHLPTQKIYASEWSKYPHLEGIPLADITERPLILIGQDHIRLTVSRKVIQGPEYLPIATKTSLGWILHGKTSKETAKQIYSYHICNQEKTDDLLHKLVKFSFTTEAFGISQKQTINPLEARALDIMEKTAKRVNGRYEIGLLWKSADITLPESKSTAFRRLQCVEKQMAKDENFRRRYCENIQKYIDKGYARKLSVDEAAREGPRCWYLPHFGVSNPNKPQKLRLVFDAASRANGTSLNDNLLPGPDLLQSLVAILLKFRQRQIAFCSDVREMFHQVRIRSEDQDSQRFLWREGNSNKIYDIYQMQVMTFGATCSPSCAQFVKNLNAKQLTTSLKILNAITKKHYVDDYLDCCDTVEEALETIYEVSRIQKQGGFELTSWMSNSKEVMRKLSLNKGMCKDLNLSCDTSIQRVLGMLWDPKEDNFVFKINKMVADEDDKEVIRRPTKRFILKTVMSIFDPLGLIVHFTIRGRMIVQEIWKTGISWDDSIDEEIYRTWTLWKADLKRIDNITIPRCYSKLMSNSKKVELHTFCDSSKKAFAAVSYLRIIDDDKIDVTLVSAKARVAPTKPLTIPRLELQAAVMGSRLAKMLKEELEIKIDQDYYWTDSTTVLYWIRGDGGRLGQFESHRVGEIQELTNSFNWFWVPSKMNPADMATRTYNESGSNETNLVNWFLGPEFLKERNKELWPREDFLQNVSGQNSNTEKRIVLVTIENENDLLNSEAQDKDTTLPDVGRFSNWISLLKATAFVTRWMNIMLRRIRKNNVFYPKHITTHELEEAELKLLLQCQKESFSEEIICLRKGGNLKKQSKIFRLSPELDKQGLLRMKGRIDLAICIKESTRHPIILPKKNHLTKLLVQYYHEKYLHQGLETVFNEIRQKYWVIDGRSVIKSVFAHCQKCRKQKAKPEVPMMGQIPVERLTPNVRPFTYVGLDYFGPLKVSVGRRSEKRWGVIFTCLTVRAIHLEVAHTLTTDSAIMAIRRMVARRGQPKVLFSDNGTNLRGANDELIRATREINQHQISAQMAVKYIDWKFNPPVTPHMGGAWERMIRSVKKSFYVAVQNQRLNDEILLTIFNEVERMINSRPLTKVSSDPNDLEALTPNHFLIGSSSGDDNFGQLLENYNLRKAWRKSQQIVNQFWKRWVKEYLPTLSRRNKWYKDGKAIKEGDIVILCEDNMPRSSWKLGKVEAVFPGPDGRIRVASVKTRNGIFKRPVAKLAKLEISEKSEKDEDGSSSRAEEM